jgi:predicted PurR-regulated permease PerM
MVKIMPVKIEISTKTIFFATGFFIFLGILWQIKEIILVLFLAFILMSALRPFVVKMEKFRVPRFFAILSIYIVLIFFLGVAGGIVLPPLIYQTIKFWEKLPSIFTKILPFLPLNLEFLTSELTPIGGSVLRAVINFFSNIFTLVTLFVLSFYLLLERGNLQNYFKTLLGEENGQRVFQLTLKIEDKLGAWVRGQLILMFVVGLFCFIGLTALGVDYALPLGLTAGLLEIVPVAGPILSGIPAVLVGLATSPILALSVVALYFLVQQAENHLIVPLVLNKALGLPPIVILIALMIGGRLGGIFGVFLAVPAVLILQTILSEMVASKK